MHTYQKQFCKSVQELYPQYFIEKKVLDCGSLDINGNNKYLFENCQYIGIDISSGSNVDIVSLIHEFDHPDKSFDTIISTETFEHDMYYEKSLKNICRLLKSNGLFLFTCATIGRKEHGTINNTPQNSPFTNNYYKNLTEQDIRDSIDLDNLFVDYRFEINEISYDLYFWGIKK